MRWSKKKKKQILCREERIMELNNVINQINNIRYSVYDSQGNLVFDASLKQPLYSYWTIFIDIVVGILYRK